MLTEAPIAMRLGSLYVAVVTLLTEPGFGVSGVAEKRGRGRGPVGFESRRKPSLNLDFSPGDKWLTADRGPAPHMRKAALVS